MFPQDVWEIGWRIFDSNHQTFRLEHLFQQDDDSSAERKKNILTTGTNCSSRSDVGFVTQKRFCPLYTETKIIFLLSVWNPL